MWHIYTESQNDNELRCGFDETVQSPESLPWIQIAHLAQN